MLGFPACWPPKEGLAASLGAREHFLSRSYLSAIADEGYRLFGERHIFVQRIWVLPLPVGS